MSFKTLRCRLRTILCHTLLCKVGLVRFVLTQAYPYLYVVIEARTSRELG